MRRRRYLAAVAAGALAGCNGRAVTTPSAGDPGLSEPSDTTYGFTFLRASGNRYVEGSGRAPTVDPVDVSLPAETTWVVAAPDRASGTTVWATVLADGRVRAHRLDGCSAEPIEPFPSYGKGPPLLTVSDGHARLVRSGSVFSHPTPIPGGSAVVNADGNLTLPGGRLNVSVQGDARVVTDGQFAYLLGGPTSYDHGALGNDVEAGNVTIIDPETRAVRTVDPPYGVIEGLSPILVEFGGDPGILVTATDGDRGASLALLRDDGAEGGSVVATSDPVGTGFNWRHQIAVAPFGPDGGTEIASVRTPHLSAEAEFHRLDGDRLVKTAGGGSYPSHEFGSRNLDRAAAADLDGDGRPELVVPTREAGVLAGVRRTASGVEEAYRLDAGAPLTSNLAIAAGPDGLELAVGTSEGLRIWPAAPEC